MAAPVVSAAVGRGSPHTEAAGASVGGAVAITIPSLQACAGNNAGDCSLDLWCWWWQAATAAGRRGTAWPTGMLPPLLGKKSKGKRGKDHEDDTDDDADADYYVGDHRYSGGGRRVVRRLLVVGRVRDASRLLLVVAAVLSLLTAEAWLMGALQQASGVNAGPAGAGDAATAVDESVRAACRRVETRAVAGIRWRKAPLNGNGLAAVDETTPYDDADSTGAGEENDDEFGLEPAGWDPFGACGEVTGWPLFTQSSGEDGGDKAAE
ncbi:hypothetical protein HK405_014270, partial [Cladochytrium tenue]